MACMMEIGYLDGVNPALVCWLKNRNADKSFNSLMVAYGYAGGKSFKQLLWQLLRKCSAERMCNPLQQRNGNVGKHNTFRTESSQQTVKEFEKAFFFSVWYRLACG